MVVHFEINSIKHEFLDRFATTYRQLSFRGSLKYQRTHLQKRDRSCRNVSGATAQCRQSRL